MDFSAEIAGHIYTPYKVYIHNIQIIFFVENSPGG